MSKSIRRINLFAGPGSGKSTTAAAVYAHFGRLGYPIELVREFIKEEMVFRGLFPSGFDQSWIMGNQIHREEKALRNNEIVVTDCPLLLGVVYSRKYGAPCVPDLIRQSLEFELQYPSLNIVLSREGIPYKEANRYQDYEDAKTVDEAVKQLLEETKTEYTVIKTVDYDHLMGFIGQHLENPDDVQNS